MHHVGKLEIVVVCNMAKRVRPRIVVTVPVAIVRCIRCAADAEAVEDA